MGLFGRIGHGGGIIKRKLLLSVLLLFGLALILNVNSASAANVTTDHTTPKVTAVTTKLPIAWALRTLHPPP